MQKFCECYNEMGISLLTLNKHEKNSLWLFFSKNAIIVFLIFNISKKVLSIQVFFNSQKQHLNVVKIMTE